MPSEPGGFVVRDHSAAAPPVARIVAARADRAAVLAARRRRSARRRSTARAARAPSSTSMPPGSRDERRELAHDAAAGRAAAGVDDAAARVAALEAEREVAVAVGVEAHAEALEVARPCRGASRHEDRAAALARTSAAAGALGVVEVLLGRVVDRERGGDPALRPVARGLRERRGGDERDARARARRRSARRRARRRRRRRRRRRPSMRLVAPHRRVPYPAPCRAGPVPPPVVAASTTPARIPSASRASSAIERALGARDWLGWDVRESPAVDAAPRSRPSIPARYVAARSRRSARAAAGTLDLDTVGRAGSCEAALHAAGGAVALVDALLGGEARVGASLHRPPGHHAERDARRWASACSTTSRSRRGTRSTRTAPSAC